MIERAKKGFAADFKRFFLRGLATLLPTILTIFLLVKCFEFIQNNISGHITRGAVWLVVHTVNDYPHVESDEVAAYLSEKNLSTDRANDVRVLRQLRREKLTQQWIQGPRAIVGFVLAIILVYIVGRLFASYLGHKFWHAFERLVQQVPGFKQIYPYIKQVTDYLLGEHKKIEFSRVVAIPYPRAGIYSIGMVTGAGFKHVTDATGEEFITVFVPNSPAPFTGYVVYVKKSEVIDLPITIEEALRFTVSGGVVVPEHQTLPRQLEELSGTPLAEQQEKAPRAAKKLNSST